MSIANNVKNLLRWYIKETKRKEIHPIIPQITIPNLLRDKVALVMGGAWWNRKSYCQFFC